MPPNTFRKHEKLTSQKVIDRLNQKAHTQTVFEYPFLLVWMVNHEKPVQFETQVLFSVPRKRFRKAVERNRIKRIMREMYRIRKSELYEQLENAPQSEPLALMIVYIGKKVYKFTEIEEKFNRLFKRFIEEYCKAA
jgi:ribonuclease P protein component